MTIANNLRRVASAIRAQLTQLDEGPASALRAQAQLLDEAVRQAERMEHVNATCLKAVKLHPMAATMGELVG